MEGERWIQKNLDCLGILGIVNLGKFFILHLIKLIPGEELPSHCKECCGG